MTPDKWVKTWGRRHPASPLTVSMVEESHQRDALYDGTADMCFVRLPIDRDGLHLIPLYREQPIVVVSREHPASVFESVRSADLEDEVRLEDLDARTAVQTVAAGTGVVFLPLSVARMHARKDVVHVPVTDLPETQVGLAWRVDNEDPRVEEFIGIVRGRTEHSSRGSGPEGRSRK